jgi:alpha-beta hydrolase superfamily lysophospholipase
MSYTEKVLSFGPSRSLHGILVEPDAQTRREGAPAILTWNVGLHHRIGPHRYFVDQTRSLAAAGFTCLRFDISGMGDSEVNRDDARPDLERAVADVHEAMAALTAQRGLNRFVPIGFCSGVDAAHTLGVNDERVAGVVYLEGYGFRTPGFYARYPLRFLERDRWERFFRSRYPHLFGGVSIPASVAQERERVFVRDYPTPAKLREDVSAMTARGARLLLIYTGGDTDYSYEKQFFDMIGQPPSEQIQVTYYADADHTFFLESDRARAIERVTAWSKEAFGPGPTPQAHSRAASNESTTPLSPAT